MTKFVNILKSFRADESGAVASEYAVLLVLIAAALIGAVSALSFAIEGGITTVTDVIKGGRVAPL